MQLTIPQALERAIQADNEARYGDANILYSSILHDYPDHAEANYRLGMLAVRVGKPHQALPFLKRAVEVRPDIKQSWRDYIDLLLKLRRYDDVRVVLRQAQGLGISDQELEQIGALASPAQNTSDVEPPVEDLMEMIRLFMDGQLPELYDRVTANLKLYPDSAQLYNLAGSLHHRMQQMDDALRCYRKATELNPDYADAYCNLGVVQKSLGDVSAALKSYNRAILLRPESATAFNNRGLALHHIGRFEEAIRSYDQAIRYQPAYAEAWFNRGNALHQLGNSEDAVTSYDRSIQLNSSHVEALNNRGISLQSLGKLDAAMESLNQAVKINPEFAEAWCNRANVLWSAERVDEAIKNLERSISLKPDYVDAYSNLCECYVVTNRPDELEQSLLRARKVIPEDNAHLLLYSAELSYMRKAYEKARDDLERIVPQELPLKLRQKRAHLLGQSLDRLAEYAEAFQQFTLASQLAMQSPTFHKVSAQRNRDHLELLNKAWASACHPVWSDYQCNETSPNMVFLIGFPRSGTTLLDSVLRSHEDVEVVEEQPMVEAMRQQLGSPATPEALAALSEQGCMHLRQTYFHKLEEYVSLEKPARVIVDKFPLNLNQTGLIKRIFPDARFIFALRHPGDSVLSCFMQNFDLNDAMANFLSIEQSAQYYASVMSLWSNYNRALDLDVCYLKYEDLVQDIRAAVEPVLTFIGLDWQENLLDYRRTARSRKIRTPSYSQVIQPLYTRSIERWRHYEEQMQSVLPLLEPWIQQFGYTHAAAESD